MGGPASDVPLPKLTHRDIVLGWGTIIQAELPALIEIAGIHGFPAITIAPAKYRHALLYGIDPAELRRQLAMAGIGVSVLDQVSDGLPGLVEGQPEGLPPTHHGGVDLETCMAIAETFDCRLLTISHYRGNPATPAARIADALGEIARRAAARGFSLALEFIPGTGVPDLATATAIRALIASVPLQLVLDTWHLSGLGGTAAQIAALPADSIAIIQLADRADPAGGAPLGRDLPGEGCLPLHNMLEAARRNSPRASIQIEIFHPMLRAMPPLAAAAKVAATLDDWLAHGG